MLGLVVLIATMDKAFMITSMDKKARNK